jgi:hypothetical protein
MNTFWPGLRCVFEGLPRRQSDHRDRGRLHEVQICRFERGGVIRHKRIFSKSTHAQVEDAGEDGITYLEASHATSNLHHDPAKSLSSVAGSLKRRIGLNVPFGIMLSIGFKPAAWT